MSRMQVASFNDVKIYHLSAGKAVPQWLPERQRRNLAKDENYRRRVELIQDLEFPTASQRIKMSPDCQYIVASGTYPPAVRVYDVQEMSMKFERRLTSEVVDFLILSEDAGKLLFLQNDRTLSFHAPYGGHYSLRIPTFGRSLGYHPPSCDVYIGASKNEVYRLNLEEGRFHAPLVVRSAEGVNCLALNPVHMLLGLGGADGTLEFVDPRSQESLTTMDMSAALANTVRDPLQVTALEYDRDGLTYGVGTSSGHCLLYDLRSSRPLVVKEHQYGLPIKAIRFHGLSRKVLSCDPKIVKVWEREAVGPGGGGGSSNSNANHKDAGAILTNIETSADLNDICVVSDRRGESGLMFMAGEQERVMAYYVPALGPAPKWCSFLDTITEELEEEESSTVYDDYKFVTRQEVDELRATDLIGTPLLRGYMHGFFMDMNLYQKLKAVSEPFAFDEWRKKKMKEKIEAKRSSRITLQKKLPKVNRALAERLIRNKTGGGEEEEEGREGTGAAAAAAAAANPLGDDRFKRLFTSEGLSGG